MTKHTETVGNHTITIEEDDSLFIAGKVIDYTFDPVSNTWSSRYLPYSTYDSLLALARAIATDSIEFLESHN